MRPSVLALLSLSLVLARFARAGGDSAPPAVRDIAVVARRFAYTPNEIHVRAGEPVTLVFTAVDFVHGFRVPALGLRADLPPGPPVRIPLQALQPGRYPFLCDNFCGAGHEEMSGAIVVDAP